MEEREEGKREIVREGLSERQREREREWGEGGKGGGEREREKGECLLIEPGKKTSGVPFKIKHEKGDGTSCRPRLSKRKTAA